jgi:5-methylcytosine-specific restriction protein A
MPYRSLRPCAYPGCDQLVTRGRCDRHKGEYVFDYHDPVSQGMYNSRCWKMLRDQQLRRQPWCEVCLSVGKYTPATDVDHIIPHLGNVEAFRNSPLQSLCHGCHSRKTASEVLNKGEGV